MVIFGRLVIDGHVRSWTVIDGHGRSWTVILVRTLMDCHFSRDAYGRSWTLMDVHFSRDAYGR